MNDALRALAAIGNAALAPSWTDGLFSEQLAFVRDRSPRRAALCGRRAGKSECLAHWLLDAAWRKPGSLVLYVALTKAAARETMQSKLKRINAARSLGLHFGEQDGQLMVRAPNGSRIWLAGCADRSECEKFRGADQGFARAAVDESASYGSYLEYLVEEVLDPALLDQRGDLALIGTPGALPSGYFYEITTGAHGRPAWPTHHWTVLSNPHVPHAREWLDRKRDAQGWGLDNPTYRREWLGEWVRDEGALVFPYDGMRNAYHELPEHPGSWLATIGIDVGYVDATAWVPVLWRPNQPELYVPSSEQRTGLIPSAVAAHTERIRAQQREHGRRVVSMVCDEGGMGKGYAAEMRERYGLPIEAAEKQSKRAAIELMRGDLLSGALKVQPFQNRELLDQWARLTWDEHQTAWLDGVPDHLADAALYAHRAARAQYRPQETAPLEGSREWQAAEKARVAARQRARLASTGWRRG